MWMWVSIGGHSVRAFPGGQRVPVRVEYQHGRTLPLEHVHAVVAVNGNAADAAKHCPTGRRGHSGWYSYTYSPMPTVIAISSTSVVALRLLPGDSSTVTTWTFAQHLKKAMAAIALARQHLWLALEGFSLSAADPDIQELPVALHHPLADPLGHAA